MKEHIVIVGAGIPGLTLALALAPFEHIDITLVDQSEPTFQWQGIDARVSAITPKSQNFFANLNVWSAMEKLGVTPYQRMHVWEAESNGAIDFASEANTCLGYMIENRVMRSVLLAEVLKNPKIKTRWPVSLVSCEFLNNQWLLTSEQDFFKADLIIGADGAQSFVREQANIELHEKSYQQTAIIATLVTEKPHEFIARQRFLKTGPLAFLPIKEAHTSSIVWSMDTDQAQAMMQVSEDEFKKMCAHAFQYRLGEIQTVSTRHAFALTMQHAKEYVQPHLALIADAAHTLHPLAGQGLNLGLNDVQALIKTLKEARAHDKPLHTYRYLRAYARAQKASNTTMLLLMRGFKELFAREETSVQALRSLGMNGLNQLEWFKKYMIKNFYACSLESSTVA